MEDRVINELTFVIENGYTIAKVNGEEIGRGKKVPMPKTDENKDKEED